MTLVVPALTSIHTEALLAISFPPVCNPKAYWRKAKSCLLTLWNYSCFFIPAIL